MASFSSLVNLKSVDLSFNTIIGALPGDWIASPQIAPSYNTDSTQYRKYPNPVLPSLSGFHCRYCKIASSLYDTVSKVMSLASLRELHLPGNNITGGMAGPRQYSAFLSTDEFDLKPLGTLAGGLASLNVLDLSFNFISGPLPAAPPSPSLLSLDLSNNAQLTGQLSGAWSQLQVLSLSGTSVASVGQSYPNFVRLRTDLLLT
jgi:hypothetical protein